MLDTMPDVDDGMAFVLECWNDLEGDRPFAWLVLPGRAVKTIGQIPFAALDAWARRKQLDAEAFALLKGAIGYLDRCRAEREASKRSLEGA